jgi:hypothetical protein
MLEYHRIIALILLIFFILFLTGFIGTKKFKARMNELTGRWFKYGFSDTIRPLKFFDSIWLVSEILIVIGFFIYFLFIW